MNPQPTFTVMIGACAYDRPDRSSKLKHSLDSISRQRRIPGDQVIVCFDSFEQDQGKVQARIDFVHDYGEGFIACEYDSGYHWLGVEQINHAMRTIPITGSHVLTIGDDDVIIDGAYEMLRPFCAADMLRPIIWQFVAPPRCILWDKPRMRACLISGCCIAAPREFVGLMHTRIETTHDYDWMMDVISKAEHQAGKTPLWLRWVGVIARPDVHRSGDVTHQGVWQCWHCMRWGYLEDRPITVTHCPCGAVMDLRAHMPVIVEEYVERAEVLS